MRICRIPSTHPKVGSCPAWSGATVDFPPSLIPLLLGGNSDAGASLLESVKWDTIYSKQLLRGLNKHVRGLSHIVFSTNQLTSHLFLHHRKKEREDKRKRKREGGRREEVRKREGRERKQNKLPTLTEAGANGAPCGRVWY